MKQRILPRAVLALGAVLTLLGCDASGQARTPRPDDAALRRRLTPIQYEVTQQDATEPPFQNEFWNNHEPGIYVDIVSGEPLGHAPWNLNVLANIQMRKLQVDYMAPIHGEYVPYKQFLENTILMTQYLPGDRSTR